MSRVNVSIDDEHLEDLEAVADALRAQGMTVTKVLSGVGIISGSVPEEQRQRLHDVDGVVAVDDDHDVELPPPDAPIQ